MTKKPIYYYKSDEFNPYNNIARECYFVSGINFSPILYLWTNDNTVVIGKHQNALAEVDYSAMNEEGAKLVRRLSGGGAVYHDKNNLNFTFVTDKSDFDKKKNFQVIIEALAYFGLKAAVSGRNDVEIDGRKFSGNAYYTSCGRVMHHGTILIDTAVSRMNKFLTVSRDKLLTHGVSSVRSRVVNLAELNPSITKDKLIEQMLLCYGKVFDGTLTEIADSQIDGEYLSAKSEELADKQWILGGGTASSEIIRRFDWGSLEVHYTLDKGVITHLQIFTDCLAVERIDEIILSLQGKLIGSLSLTGERIYDDIAGQILGLF